MLQETQKTLHGVELLLNQKFGCLFYKMLLRKSKSRKIQVTYSLQNACLNELKFLLKLFSGNAEFDGKLKNSLVTPLSKEQK